MGHRPVTLQSDGYLRRTFFILRPTRKIFSAGSEVSQIELLVGFAVNLDVSRL